MMIGPILGAETGMMTPEPQLRRTALARRLSALQSQALFVDARDLAAWEQAVAEVEAIVERLTKARSPDGWLVERRR